MARLIGCPEELCYKETEFLNDTKSFRNVILYFIILLHQLDDQMLKLKKSQDWLERQQE